VSEKVELKYTRMAEEIELDKDVVERLRNSDYRFRWSFPVIMSRRTNRIIDGRHRKAADPKWTTIYIDTEDDAEEFAARLVLNLNRRTMNEEEKRILVGAIAEQLLMKGVKRENLVDEIMRITKLSKSWVYKYLPDEFKRDKVPDFRQEKHEIPRRGISIETKQEKVEEVKEIKLPPPIQEFPFTFRGRITKMEEAPADQRKVWIEGLSKPILVNAFTWRYSDGELKVGDEVEVVIEGDAGGYFEFSSLHKIRHEVEEMKEEGKKVESKEEKEGMLMRIPSAMEVASILVGYIMERWGDYVSHDSLGNMELVSVMCDEGVLTIEIRYPERVAEERGYRRREKVYEPKSTEEAFNLEKFKEEMRRANIPVKITSEKGVVKVSVDGYLKEDQFKKYVEICKKHGLKYDSKTKTWSIKVSE